MGPLFALSLLASAPTGAVLVRTLEVGAGIDLKDARTLGDALVEAVADVERAHGGARVYSDQDLRRAADLEADRQAMDCSEEAGCLAELGLALGAERVVGGRVARLDDDVLLQLWVLDVPSATITTRRTAKGASLSGLLASLPAEACALLGHPEASKRNGPGPLLGGAVLGAGVLFGVGAGVAGAIANEVLLDPAAAGVQKEEAALWGRIAVLGGGALAVAGLVAGGALLAAGGSE
jgi:hypothetical protein